MRTQTRRAQPGEDGVRTPQSQAQQDQPCGTCKGPGCFPVEESQVDRAAEGRPIALREWGRL